MDETMSSLPKFVKIVEVGPRDGLQIERKILMADQKLSLVAAIATAGVAEIEVGSFVNPKAVPQMADTDELIMRLPSHANVTYRGLWLNLRGLDRAIATARLGIEGELSLTASETFSKRNTNRDTAQTLEEMRRWITRYMEAGVEPDGLSIMAAFGCNFEGHIEVSRLVELIERAQALLAEAGHILRRLTLADTMGWANPMMVQRIVGEIRNRWPELVLKLHLHDTRGMAMANAIAAIKLGVAEFDASVGGLGGCPFAGHKGAAGNICTEDLAHMCHEIGIDTGIDVTLLIEAAKLAEHLVGHELPGKVMKAGPLGHPARVV